MRIEPRVNGSTLAMLCRSSERTFLIRGLHPRTTSEEMTTPLSDGNRYSGRYDRFDPIGSRMRLHCFSIIGIARRLPDDAKVQLIEVGPHSCLDTVEAEEKCLDVARLVGLARLVKCWCWFYINTRCPNRSTVRTAVQHQHWANIRKSLTGLLPV